MNEKDRIIVKELKSRIPPNIKRHFEKIIVYGSRARDMEDEFSDLDIAIIVDKKGPVLEQELEEIAYQIMWENDFKPLISLKLFSKSDFNQALKNGFSFYRNIEREGIVL